MKINSPDQAYPVPLTATDETPASTKPRIMVPIVSDEPSPTLARLALALATDRTEVILLRPVSVSEQTPLELADSRTEEHEAVLQDVMDLLPEVEVPVEKSIRAGRGVDDIIANAVDDHGITTLLLPHGACEPTSLPSLVRPDLGTRVRRSTGCDVVVVRGSDRLSEITSIAVAVAGGPHSDSAIDVAAGLARGFDASLDLLHVIEEDASPARRDRGRQRLATAAERLGEFDQYESRLVETDDVADAIVEECAAYDLAITGASRKGRLRRFVHGSTAARVQIGAESALLTVHQREAEGTDRWNPIGG